MVYYSDPVNLFLRDGKVVPHWFCFHYFFAFKINLFSSSLAQFSAFQKLNPAKIINQRNILPSGGGRGPGNPDQAGREW